MINRDWPSYSKEEVKKVTNILKSGKVNYWTGNECKKFETLFKNKFNLNNCITLSNGTVALEAALKSLDLKWDDEIVVPSKSYQSSASAIVNTGAKPIFCDIDFNSQNIELSNLKKKITKKTKAIICVHLGGWPCEMNKIVSLAKKHNLKIIEDCSQAHGAKINNRYVGSFGDFAIWSFCNDKIISTGGEGGMLSIKKRDYWKKIWSYKEIGKNYDKIQKNLKNKSSGFQWVHDYFGTNLRMTEIQAAIGIIQLNRLDKTLNKRNKINKMLWNNLRKIKSITVPSVPMNVKLAPYRCYVKVNFDYIKKEYKLKNIIKLLNKHKTICNEGSCSEMYLENSFKMSNYSPKVRLKNASKLTAVSLAFFINPLTSKSGIENNIRYIKKVFNLITIN